jgi:metal-responsive CopG/Arc/MetJ family transcriptional regulator
MVKLGTSCQECRHFTNKDKSCDLNLYQVFEDRNAEIKYLADDVTIDRICPHKNTDPLNDKDVYIFGTIILIANNRQDLESTIKKINAEEKVDKFKIIVLYTGIPYHEMLDSCINNIKSPYKLIKMTTDDIPYQVYRSLKYAKNGMLFILECGKEIEENLIDKVDNIINKKLYRILHIHHNDELHQSVSMVHLYKWIKGHLGETMRFKLDDIANQENSEAQIYTWKEVNEQYIN